MSFPYQDPGLSIEARARDLLARMSLDEKAAQLHALWLLLSEDGEHRPRQDDFTGGTDPAAVRKALGHGLGQISRALGSHGVEPRAGVRALNRLQKFLREETRLGIPALSHEECLVGLMARGATMFPSALAYAATFDPELIERVARAIGREARSVGCHQGLAPVLDVSRDVRWGRTEETLGEDPYLVGVLGTRFVRGLQGEKRDLLATLKHFAGHSWSEGARNHGPVHLGWRELNDVFLLPFEMAVKQANAGSVMPAYHDVDNESCHASRHLLTKVLREEWGFDGLVVADYIGVSLLYQHHNLAADPAEAAALAFRAGLDIELPADDCVSHLAEAVGRGLLSMETIDAAVMRVLVEKLRLGLFERPYVDVGGIELQSSATVELAREVAREAVVVLENRGVLPLDPARGQRIALVGPTADDPLAMLCGYSFPVHLILNDAGESAAQVDHAASRAREGVRHRPRRLRAGLLRHRAAQVRLARLPGRRREEHLARPAVARLDPHGPHPGGGRVRACRRRGDRVRRATSPASSRPAPWARAPTPTRSTCPACSSSCSRPWSRPGKPVVVVLTSGRPYNLGGLEDEVAAFVWAFAGGQQGGPALVDVLTGRAPASGRLPVSVPKNVGAVPYYYNHKLKSAGTPIARHFGSRYPFGHGLGYTEFAFSDLALEAQSVDTRTGEIRLSFALRNTGSRPGTAVPQLYVRDLLASVVRPVKELKAFGRVALGPGESARVSFEVPTDTLCFTGPDGRRIVEPGEVELQVGVSSADIRLRAAVTLTGTVHVLGRDWRMESRCRVVR